MNKKNVIFIVVDAVRSYKSGNDERDRLAVYDDLKYENFIPFEKLVVSAPSSVMSSITMLTGIPSYTLAQNYNNFKWELDLYDVLPKILSRNGYEIFGLFGTKEMRDKMKDIFPPIKRNLLSKNTNTRQKKWSNKELLDTTKQYFKSKTINKDKPFFLMTWFNSRFDFQASKTIEEFIFFLKNNHYFDDSLIILTADHGYPDKMRGLTSDGIDLKKFGKPHDLIVTDDNIGVPLSIRFPNKYSKTNKIKNFLEKGVVKKVMSQETLAPTILDVLNIKFSKDKLLQCKRNDIYTELIDNSNVPIRSDARFIFQPNRITSIRTNEYKYINDKENREEYYFDLVNDPKEKEKNFDIKCHKVSNLKNLYLQQEKQSTLIWLRKAKQSLSTINLEVMIDKKDEFNLIFLGQSVFITPFIQVLQKHNKTINLLVVDENVINQIKNLIDITNVNLLLLDKITIDKAIIIIEDTYDLIWINKFRDIKAKNILIIDLLFNLSHSKTIMVLKSKIKFVLGPLNRMYYRRELYRDDYFLLINDFLYIVKRAISILFSNFFRLNRS